MSIQDVVEHELTTIVEEPILPTVTANEFTKTASTVYKRGNPSLTAAVLTHDQVKLLSTPDTMPDAPNTGSNSHKAGNIVGLGNQAASLEGTDWGPYEAAIRRWERVLGRPAPPPVRHDGRNGKARLNPELTEWMMGWPAGWVTDPALGLTREQQLKACGNGVVPQQAEAALRELLAREGVPSVR